MSRAFSPHDSFSAMLTWGFAPGYGVTGLQPVGAAQQSGHFRKAPDVGQGFLLVMAL